jgi:hypothetical protein
VLAIDENLSECDRIQLSTHRRTPFVTPLGGRAAAENEPLYVIQIALGHQSMQTMLIYVQAEPRWLSSRSSDTTTTQLAMRTTTSIRPCLPACNGHLSFLRYGREALICASTKIQYIDF